MLTKSKKKQLRKERRKAISEAKKHNGGSKNRVTKASFYRKWDEETDSYSYVLEATRAGHEFDATVPVDFERDRFLEINLIFRVVAIQWGWQQPDCEAYLALIEHNIYQEGNDEHLKLFEEEYILGRTEEAEGNSAGECGAPAGEATSGSIDTD